MQKLKILVLIAAFALVGAACGGSDDAASDAFDVDVPDAEDVVNEDGVGDAATSDGTSEEVSIEDLPELLEIEPILDRDCAHTARELADPENEFSDVELPPDEKPVVDDEYLGDFDELTTIDLIEGTGRVAEAGANVTLQYVGVLGADGTQFDASWDTGRELTFVLGAGQVIEGWDEGIAGMQVGGRRVLQIPSEQAYGSQQRSEIIVADSDLVFIVDLLDASAPPEPAPPVDDQYLGEFEDLQIVDLADGDGCEVQTGDIVSVNYVGIDTATGEEIDNSWARGAPFDLIAGRSQVIDGWNEGLVGMNVGGERILQIPSDMAYGEGDLVFRIHVESLDEAPELHQLEFDGDVPDDLEITALVDGAGPSAAVGDIVDANIVVMLHESEVIVQSSWQQGMPAQLVLQQEGLLPGLFEGLDGIQAGETRQVIIPLDVAYPDGIPPDSGLEEGDAIVFLIETLRVTTP